MASILLYRKHIRIMEQDINKLQAAMDMGREEFQKSAMENSEILKLFYVPFESGFKIKIMVISGRLIGEEYEKGYVTASLLNGNENPVGESLTFNHIEGQYKFININEVYIVDIIGE